MQSLRPLRRAALLLPLALAAAPAAAQDGGAPARADAWRAPALPAPAPVAPEEYAARRAALAARLGDGVLVVLGAGEPQTDYEPFAQSPAFRYLTGITEPNAALVVEKSGGQVRQVLFVQDRVLAREIWEGPRLGPERAAALTGLSARPIGALDATVDSLMAGDSVLYTAGPLSIDGSREGTLRRDQQLVARIAQRHPGARVVPVDRALFELRGAKSAAELDRIRRAVVVTILAQREAMRAIRPGMNEFEVQALIEATFRRHGADRPSFASIVGSGPNATVLHYREADRFMEAGDVVVMDVGASYRGYAADVTRTVPVSGTFTPAQRAIYQTVLDAQKAAEAAVRPGATWMQATAAARDVVARGLTRAGLIESPDATYDCGPDGARQCPQVGLFFMHGLGHGIGLDVHDPDVSFSRGFAEGSVFTLEPGIYVRADVLEHLPDTPANRALARRLAPAVRAHANVGVRIEDDYLLTAAGLERLSAGAPREVAEIEALMREESPWNAGRRGEIVEWYRATEP